MTKEKNIETIFIAGHTVETWYYSPFPESYWNIKCLRFCEFCLAFFKTIGEFNRHCDRCPLKTPPGNELYRDYVKEIDKTISVYELDGGTNWNYC